MDPKLLVPAPDVIPAPWPLFKVLLVPCFTIHLLFMNALLGSAIIGWVHALRNKAHGQDVAESIRKKLPFQMAFAINFGVAALLFMQVLYGHFFYTSSILMGVWWLVVLALVLMAYGAAYWLDFRFETLGALRLGLLSVMVIGLLMVAFVFVNNLTLMANPSSWTRYFDTPGGTLWHLEEPTLLPRYLHFVIASVAVGGLLLAAFNYRGNPERAAGGFHWFTAATAIQFVVGGWFFMTLPESIRLSFMGGNVEGSVLFGGTLLLALLTLILGIKQMLWPTVGATALTVLGMVLVRDVIRTAYLAPYFSVEELAVQYEVSPVVVFALFVLIGVAAVGYMAKLWKGAKS